MAYCPLHFAARSVKDEQQFGHILCRNRSMPPPKSPPIVTGCAPLFARYDVLFCDVWGVVHDGHTAIQPSNDALRRFRGQGGTVILLTNAPQPAGRVAEILAEKNVQPDVWDAIVTSGEIALSVVQEQGYQAILHIGPEWRSRPLMAKLPGLVSDIGAADAIVCSGLIDDHNETADSYRPLLERALQRNVPFICANPDLWVHVGEKLLPCAGVIATLYEQMGGPVVWAGKPHKPVYDAAFQRAAELRGKSVLAPRILAVGDALRTDLAGAEAAGIDSLFVASGIHRDEVMERGAIEPAKLARLFAEGAPAAVAATAVVSW